jgi:nucleoside-diphosphate-sugar epimerase
MAVTDINVLSGGTVMRIFVTGASGWIGSAVVPELLDAGHDVVGLARSDASAQRLEAAGAMVLRGDVDDPDVLAKAAADSDGVIHLAFQHEVAWSGNFGAAAAADRRAVEAMGGALADSDRPFVLASGMLGLTAGRVATEDDGLVPSAEMRANPAGRRAATALLALSLRGIGVRSSGAALPPDGPRRRRPRVRGHPRRHRPPAGRGRIRG